VAIKDQSWSADGNPHHVPTAGKYCGVLKQPDGKTHYEIWPGSWLLSNKPISLKNPALWIFLFRFNALTPFLSLPALKAKKG